MTEDIPNNATLGWECSSTTAPPACCSNRLQGPANENKASLKEEVLKKTLLHNVHEVRCRTTDQVKMNKDHFEIRIMQRYYSKVQEQSTEKIGNEQNRIPLIVVKVYL